MHLPHWTYHGTPLDTADIPQDALNIENKSRSNPLPWNGQFSPQLVNNLLCRYALPDSVILDPFVGSGTVLMEAGRIGMTAFGSEINPAAVAMSRVYQYVNVPLKERQTRLAEANAILGKRLPETSSLSQDQEMLKWTLADLALRDKDFPPILANLLVLMADFYKPGLSVGRIFDVWRKIVSLILKLPYSNRCIRAFNADARNLPLDDSSIDLVLTSPPYINVFNYHQRFRASMEALDWDLLRVARSEFGANRKHRSNRFLTVIQFCLDISQALAELERVCAKDARIIFIVGRESTVCGTRFFNGEIVSEIAHRVLGFELTLRQERVFLNRYGQEIYEDILHFSPWMCGAREADLKKARQVTRQILEAAYSTAATEAMSGLKAALESVEKVSPSPMFSTQQDPDSTITAAGDLFQEETQYV